jgi:uncharacterized protein (DUF952 family)
MSDRPAIAYKVLTADQMRALEADAFEGAPIDLTDGYIHLSTSDQLTETVDRHFAGQSGLWVAAIDLAALGDSVRWEESRGGALFPHVYGTMPLDVVIAYGELERDDDGTVKLPVAG